MRTRQDILDGGIAVDHVTECWPMLNTDSFDYPKDFPPPPIQE